MNGTDNFNQKPALNCATCKKVTSHLAADGQYDHWSCGVCGTNRHWGGAIVGKKDLCPWCPRKEALKLRRELLLGEPA